jgi:hypothetical protein
MEADMRTRRGKPANIEGNALPSPEPETVAGLKGVRADGPPGYVEGPRKMTDIYEQHDKAFSRVSAFIILDGAGERVATVAIKFPADGTGRLWAYTHFMGLPMTRGHAGGYGYDKRSPAVANGFAAAGLALAKARKTEESDIPGRAERLAAYAEALLPIVTALAGDGGEYWDRRLEKAGYRVLQAV